jgi:hypothetical protein
LALPDDAPEDHWPEDDASTEPPSVPHDDIMKRLLDYQRSLREGASPEEAAPHAQSVSTEDEASTPANGVVDLSTTEPEIEIEEPRGADVGLVTESEAPPEVEAPPEPVEPPELFTPVEPVDEAGVREPPAAIEPPRPFEPPGLPDAVEREPIRPGPPEGRAELEARVAALEERLGRLATKLSDLRQSFQDMAVAADERLAAMQDELGRVREEPPDA